MLSWQFDNHGTWTALSDYPEQACFYQIDVTDQGEFDLSESDDRLLGKTERNVQFMTLEEAKSRCQKREFQL